MTTSSDSPTIFIVGASGFIGGQILHDAIAKYPESPITVQYRAGSERYIDIFKAYSKNITPIKASFDDYDILKEQASKHDIVIAAADCDDMKSNKALVEGLEQAAEERIQAKKLKAIYIHTSGTGELIDPDVAPGELDPTVYDDADVDQTEAMPKNRAHRDVTLMVCDALGRGHFLGYIVLPSTIYGRGQGPIHTKSQQIPGQTTYALEQKRAIYVNPGKNLWSGVHIHDLGRLYIDLAALLRSDKAPPPPHRPQSHYIYACNEKPFSWKEITLKIGDLLKDMGLVEEGSAIGKDAKDLKDVLAGGTTEGGKGTLTPTTSVGKSSNAKRLVNWQPREKSVFDTLPDDVRDVVDWWKSTQQK